MDSDNDDAQSEAGASDIMDDDGTIYKDPVPLKQQKKLEEEKKLIDSAYQRTVRIEGGEYISSSRSGSSTGSGIGINPVTHVTSRPASFGAPSDTFGSSLCHLKYSGTGGDSSQGYSGVTQDVLDDLLEGKQPPSLELALKYNFVLQQRFSEKLRTLERVLQNNRSRQLQLREELGDLKSFRDGETSEKGNKNTLRISHFCVPYFKDRSGMPTPMNEDAKFKVENGYLDLYTTRSRPWLTSERDQLTKAVHREYKELLINKWTVKKRDTQRKLRQLEAETQQLSDQQRVEDEKKKVDEEEQKGDEEKQKGDEEKQKGDEEKQKGDEEKPKVDEEKQKVDEEKQKMDEEKRKLQEAEREAKKDELKKQLSECENHITYVTSLDPKKVHMDRRVNVDWIKVAAQEFDGHRTPEECELQWKNLLHPSINTSPWSEQEDIAIQEQVEIYKQKKPFKPDWDKIAQTLNTTDLNTQRTGYLVMQRWVSFIHPTLEPAKWTSESTQKLIDTINMLRSGSLIPWAQVHQHMVGFSRPQIQSRWRVVNPEQSKGPFTVEEDFILIKGLHKFGLNFSLISHFMPGRSVAQVRDRYKRTILPGLAKRPWTFAEDSIITRRCQVGPRNWKRMMINLPRHDSCEIRCRYHIIQVWQTITDGSNMRPPPLFPISMTVDKDEVREIRKSLIQEKPDAKTLVDKSRNEIDVKSAVKELEDRRRLIKNRKVATSVKRLEKAVEKRGRKPGTSIPHNPSLPDMLLTDFFLPGRDIHKVSWQNHQSEENALAMAECLQLKLTEAISNEEWEISRELNVTNEDRAIIDYIMQKIPSDEKHKLGAIPLIPANHTNTGGLHSLLLHRPKLEDMATGDFIFYKLRKEEYKNLGRDPNSLKKMLKQTGKNAGVKDEVSANKTADSPTASPNKIRMTSARGSRGRGKGTWYNRITYDQDSGTGTGSDVPSEDTVTDSNMSIDNTDVSREYQEPKSEEEKAHQERSDELLFHRFLSIFYWPALMTLVTPSMNKLEETKHILSEIDSQTPRRIRRPATALKLAPKDVLDIESQVKYIDELMVEQEKYGQLAEEFKGKRERGDQADETIEQRKKQIKVENSEANQVAEKSTETMEIQQVEIKTQTKGRKPRGRANKGVNELSRIKLKKKLVTSLKRSLVMKKVWEARRAGTVKDRTANRDKRLYNPRETRTRRSIRQDLIKPSKPDKPWELPLSGPMYVQQIGEEIEINEENIDDPLYLGPEETVEWEELPGTSRFAYIDPALRKNVVTVRIPKKNADAITELTTGEASVVKANETELEASVVKANETELEAIVGKPNETEEAASLN